MQWLYTTLWFVGWIVLLAGIVWTLRAFAGDLSRGRRRCPRCWYDMSGAPAMQCPECGKTARSVRTLFRTRRHPMHAALGMVVMFAALVIWRLPLAIQSGWWAAVPTPVLVVFVQFWDSDADVVFQRVQSRLAGNPSGLSSWEKLLLARHCGRVLDRPAPPPPTPLNVFPTAWPADPRREALGLLLQLGPSAKPAVPALTRALEDQKIRHEVLDVLSTTGPGAGSAMGAVFNLMADPEFRDCAHAFNTLKAIGSPTQATLTSALRVIDEHPDLYVKITAVGFVIAMFTPDQAVPAFERLLTRPSIPTRVAAARGLERTGTPAERSIPAIAAATCDPAFPINAAGVSVLVSFREKAVSSLAMLAVHPDPEVARPAAAAIGLLGPAGAPAVPSLVRALLHDNPFVPPHAANSLGMIGPAAIDAVPDLRRIADDHLAGAHEAERAIQRIDVRSPPAVRGG